MNELPVLILLKDNLHLSKKCLASVLSQDVPVLPWLINNASTDGTLFWTHTLRDTLVTTFVEQKSVAAAWNHGLKWLFDVNGCAAVLVLNNDTELRPDTARHLLADGGGFVTAVGSDDPRNIPPKMVRLQQEGVDADKPAIPVYPDPDPAKKRPHPDFSCYLIRKSTWDEVGPFDEQFKTAFGEDCDTHCRLHKAGIKAESLDLPFYHVGSATINNATNEERDAIHAQAVKNRAYFKDKWGFELGSKEYYDFFGSNSPDPNQL